MTSPVVPPKRFCAFSDPLLYQRFDESGTSILPCGQCRCETELVEHYKPVSTKCVNVKCGKRFRSPCPGIIYCCQECFEATNTLARWDAAINAKLERNRKSRRERKKKHLKTDKGKMKKREQNKRYYLTKKKEGKTQGAYARQKILRQMPALTDPPISSEVSDDAPLVDTALRLKVYARASRLLPLKFFQTAML